MRSFERRNSGSDVEIKVGRVECKNVTGAIDHGNVHERSEFRVDMTDLGGCVEGVSMSFVLAMSRGASIMPATLAAKTATASDDIGAGEDRISRPPAEPVDVLMGKDRLGSGIAKIAARNERVKEVRVERKIEWT